MKKHKVGLIFGGPSMEHEVSLLSAKNIARELDRALYELVLIGVSKEGQWYVLDTQKFLVNETDPTRIAIDGGKWPLLLKPGTGWLIEKADRLIPLKLDVAFPIIHGTFGEDGILQALMETSGVPYVGCNVLGSAVCMDKEICKKLLLSEGIDVAPFTTLHRDEVRQAEVQPLYEDLMHQLGTVLFLKPASQGSSVGVTKVRNQDEFSQALRLAFQYDHKVLVESAVQGREIECALLGNETPEASVCGEILLEAEFYSYQAKYVDGDSASTLIPADLPADVMERMRTIAKRVYRTLGCRGLARVDMFLTAEGTVLINEVNTLPGFTDISMYPQLWLATGLSYTNLLTRLIELALMGKVAHVEARL